MYCNAALLCSYLPFISLTMTERYKNISRDLNPLAVGLNVRWLRVISNVQLLSYFLNHNLPKESEQHISKELGLNPRHHTPQATAQTIRLWLHGHKPTTSQSWGMLSTTALPTLIHWMLFIACYSITNALVKLQDFFHRRNESNVRLVTVRAELGSKLIKKEFQLTRFFSGGGINNPIGDHRTRNATVMKFFCWSIEENSERSCLFFHDPCRFPDCWFGLRAWEGSGTAGRTFVSETRDPQFKSNHNQIINLIWHFYRRWENNFFTPDWLSNHNTIYFKLLFIRGLHSTEVAHFLLTQQTLVKLPAFPKKLEE